MTPIILRIHYSIVLVDIDGSDKLLERDERSCDKIKVTNNLEL